MSIRLAPLSFVALGSLAWFAPVSAHESSDAATVQVTLKHKVLKSWDIVLPKEQWNTVSGSIDIPHREGDGFTTVKSGVLSMEVDTNGDGKVDKKVKGVKDFIKLRGKYEDGETMSYGLRLRNDGKNWQYAPGGAMTGKIDGTLVYFFDLNSNGRYDEVGVDAVTVGKQKGASLFSRVMNVDGKLFEVELDETGRSLSYQPYTGETGTIDLASDFEAEGGLVAAVVSSLDGEYHFNVASGEMKVPAGSYRLASGYVTRKKESVRIETGRMQDFEVAATGTAKVEWGGPVTIEFDAKKDGETVTVPASFKIFGMAGEEYVNFLPDTTSPKVIVSDKKSGKELASGRFGRC